MSLTWPWALTALLAFPLLLGFRWWLRRRRRRDAVRVSSLTLIRAALPGPTSWRRRIPLWLLAGALLILGVGAARPTASVVTPSDDSAILLAMDMSGSMCSTDVPPNRLTAAQNAARDFIKAQPAGTKIGIVGFAGHATVLVEPTADRQALLDAIANLRTSRGTAIGLGILAALDAIADINPDVAHSGVEEGANGAASNYQPDTIVVLTDGANTQGVPPVTAAHEAAARGVRVYTIGFGTADPGPLACSSDQISGDPFGGRGFGGGGGFGRGGFGGGGAGIFLDIDEQGLTQVADITGGEYFQAQDAKQLDDALLGLPSHIVLARHNTELTVWFALAGALLVTTALGLSLWWQRRPVTRASMPATPSIPAWPS
ncbi:MAG TPA: VWA domain-containing protein [Micromonosporaceae bacterium]|jgi:Ca-activated chloride channel family protein